VRANPFEAGKTVGYLISWAARKMGGASPAQPAKQQASTATASAAPTAAGANAGKNQPPQSASATADTAPLQKYDSDPAFAKLKAAVVAFLQ
jgi:predicted lipid-binding transport protein (Tim44 family)